MLINSKNVDKIDIHTMDSNSLINLTYAIDNKIVNKRIFLDKFLLSDKGTGNIVSWYSECTYTE